MRVTREVRRAAAETAQLAIAFGSGEVAAQAIEAAATAQHRKTVEEIIGKAEAAAQNVQGDLDPGVVYILRWFADLLRKELGPDADGSPYEPGDGDYIEITFGGELRQLELFHPGLGREIVWEFTTDEGVTIPLNPDDFAGLRVTRLLGGDDV